MQGHSRSVSGFCQGRYYAEIAAIVRHHHERVDGEGYPDGLEVAMRSLFSRGSSRSPMPTTQ